MKKRKVAMFLAYVGHGYQGMQRNPGARTIEDELFKALHAAGAISDANADDNGFMKVPARRGRVAAGAPARNSFNFHEIPIQFLLNSSFFILNSSC